MLTAMDKNDKKSVKFNATVLYLSTDLLSRMLPWIIKSIFYSRMALILRIPLAADSSFIILKDPNIPVLST